MAWSLTRRGRARVRGKMTKRGFLLLAAAGFAIGAAGCGFSPAYGPQGAGTPLTGALRADDPTNRDSFDFVAAIEARFGVAANPQFALSYLIAIREEY